MIVELFMIMVMVGSVNPNLRRSRTVALSQQP